MARYTGPKNKISRRFGVPIYGSKDKSFELKTQLNRQYIKKRRRVNKSEYNIHLLEKQKMKYIYGVLEKQCRKMFYTAYKSKGVTGEVLLQLMESRLDNVVFRMGLAVSRKAARQLVSHGHIIVNEKKNNIPSYMVKPGDIISIINKSSIKDKIINNNSTVEWIVWHSDKMYGIFKYIPERNQIPVNINEQLIVQWYSK